MSATINPMMVPGPPVIQITKNSKQTVIPPLPKPHNYGMCKQQRDQEYVYISALRDKPPIEYIAEFLCNIFQHCTDKETGESYFYDGMGRTFFETILHLFSSKSNYDKTLDLHEKFKHRGRKSNGDFAVFRGNHVSQDEMRELIPFFYNYFQENDDMYFNYFEFHYYYRSYEDKPNPPVMNEFINDV